MLPKPSASRSLAPRTHSLVAAAALSALITGPAFAASPSPEEVAKAQSEAYRASVAQDTLRRDAVNVQEELASIRKEISQFLPDQVKLVDRAFEKLSSLSENEMISAVASLRSASSAEEMSARLTALAGAKEDQNVIGNSLRQVAVDLKAQETAKALAEILNKLVRSQATAASTTQRALDFVTNDGNKLDAAQKGAASAQDFVNSDLRLLNADLTDLAKNLPQGPQREIFVNVLTLAGQGQLPATSEAALASLRSADMANGLVGQKKVLDTLVAMLSALQSKSSISEQLQEKIAEAKTLARVQDDLAKSEGLEKKPATMEETQKSLADRAAELAAVLQPLNNKAAEDVRAAKAEMEEAMKAMAGSKEEKAEAPDKAVAAARKLDETVKDLESQLAKAESPSMPDSTQELAQALQQLQNATAQAATDQKNSVLSGQQNPALQERVEQIQEYAAAVAPEAAAKLGEAAANMAEKTPQAQQQAAQDLAEANKALQEQMADLTGKSPEQQALNAAENLAQKAQQEAEAAQKNADPIPPQKPNTAEASKDLAEAQKSAEAASKAAQAAGAPEDTKEALAKAQEEIKKGQEAAAQGKAPEAGAAAENAQKALGEAQKGLADAKAEAAAKAAAAMQAQNAQNAQGQQPGQQPGQQQAGQQPGQPQPGQQPGQPQPNGQNQSGQQSGQVSQNANSPNSNSTQNSKDVNAARLINSGGNFAPQPVAGGISSTDRAAVAQLAEEKPPRDFVPTVQQYYKNLADGAGQ